MVYKVLSGLLLMVLPSGIKYNTARLWNSLRRHQNLVLPHSYGRRIILLKHLYSLEKLPKKWAYHLSPGTNIFSCLKYWDWNGPEAREGLLERLCLVLSKSSQFWVEYLLIIHFKSHWIQFALAFDTALGHDVESLQKFPHAWPNEYTPTISDTT